MSTSDRGEIAIVTRTSPSLPAVGRDSCDHIDGTVI